MAKITKRYCEGRKSPYQLFWIEGGVRHSRFFETEEARADFQGLTDIWISALLKLFWELTKILFPTSPKLYKVKKYFIK